MELEIMQGLFGVMKFLLYDSNGFGLSPALSLLLYEYQPLNQNWRDEKI
jgi:hypothetical protein